MRAAEGDLRLRENSGSSRYCGLSRDNDRASITTPLRLPCPLPQGVIARLEVRIGRFDLEAQAATRDVGYVSGAVLSMDGAATLGKYEIRGTLGRGAMGTVYRGWDPAIARQVAIKTVAVPEGTYWVDFVAESKPGLISAPTAPVEVIVDEGLLDPT